VPGDAISNCRPGLQSPEIVVATWRAARTEIEGLRESEVREALDRLDPLWDELFPAEQARIVQLLVERVDVGVGCLDIRLRVDGLNQRAAELRSGGPEVQEAA
jgi:site-specific DNA recombinase